MGMAAREEYLAKYTPEKNYKQLMDIYQASFRKQLMTHFILGMRLDATSYSDLIQKTKIWAEENQARSIYAANTHMVMEAYDDPAFRQVVNDADLVTPDGMPLVWCLRWQGVKGQSRVYGPDVMLHLCDFAAQCGSTGRTVRIHTRGS